MSNKMGEEIISYIKNQSRNKIVIHKEIIPEIKSLNVGSSLSKLINNISKNERFTLKAKSKLEEFLINSTTDYVKFGKVLSIYNLGILFEPELKIDFLSLIDKYSKNNTLFIQWEGETENNKLFFLSKLEGIEINIKNLSHIMI